MSSPLLHSSTVQHFGRHFDLEIYRDDAVFQTITYIRFSTALTGAVAGLFLSGIAMAQTASDDPLPNPQNRPSVESYSLPPGPGSVPEKNVLQGPVDAEIPLAEPTIVTPRPTPAKQPPPLRTPGSDTPATRFAVIDKRADPLQPTVRQTPLKPEATAEKSATETDSAPIEAAVTTDERQDSTAAPADTNLPPTAILAEPAPRTATDDWIILSFAILLFVLLGAFFLWRARSAASKQSAATGPDHAKSTALGDITDLAEPLEPLSAIGIGFQPHSANATLINAVLGFELTLSNHGGGDLTDIRVNGTMVQAEGHGAGDPALADLSPLREVPNLPTGETEKIVAEFRIPLAGIRPIQFGSQALFVPLVQISIEFTDGSGFQHLQTAAYLVGREHQPPRAKMAPFRLDLGPRSFAPLGHRPLAVS
tara:strand:+ start:14599 stop:15867 length:1269 start_codon:yes stop_codon:yes gene_type:complete